MQISRAINTDLTRHRLGIICRANKIQYDEAVAHRGDFDAEVLNSV
jgi:DNA polymerase-3 subunit alpha (Gram-positive type)